MTSSDPLRFNLSCRDATAASLCFSIAGAVRHGMIRNSIIQLRTFVLTRQGHGVPSLAALWPLPTHQLPLAPMCWSLQMNAYLVVIRG